MSKVTSPFGQFYDLDGTPLDEGFIYIGTENTEPSTNPVSVYFDSAFTLPAAQPLKTINGFITLNGAPKQIFVSGSYSIRVTNKNGLQVFYSPSSDVDIYSLQQSLAASTGSSLVNLSAVTQKISVATTVTDNTDTVFANHTSNGASGSGYAFHALDGGDGAAGGGAIGGATSRTTQADAIVGNRRDAGTGNGVIGTRWESGNGHGVAGVMRGSGTGNGVDGYIVLGATGHGVHGKHEGTVDGSGVYGERLNGAGLGHGVFGYASGANGISNASVFGQKLSGDEGHAVSADGRGTHAALKAFAANNSAETVLAVQDATNTASASFVFDKQNGKAGDGIFAKITGGGARTAVIVANKAHIIPSVSSTGAGAAYAIDAQISANITGSADVRGVNAAITSTGGTSSYGVVAVATGANTTNYGIYGNAAGGTTNWSAYFVGNVFYGGTLTPSDKRLKDIHYEVDTAESLRNVLACKVYCYDKYSSYRDENGNEIKEKILFNEVGNLAQDIQKVTPSHVVEAGEYLAVNDRSELYQLKAAVQELYRLLQDKK